MKRHKKHIKQANASGKMPCEICGLVEFLEEHHISGRDIPNANFSFNLANICSNCHTRIHRGEIIVEKWITTTEGRKLFWHKKDEESFTGEDSKPKLIA